MIVLLQALWFGRVDFSSEWPYTTLHLMMTPIEPESLAQVERIVTAAATELRQDIADSKRHTGVLVEGLRSDIQLMAEGLQMHIERQHAEEREYLDRQFRETRALIQLSYEQLRHRVEALEHRVSNIEQHLGLSA